MAAAAHVRLQLPSQGRSCTAVYPSSPEHQPPKRPLTLYALARAVIKHAVALAGASPGHGPPRLLLISKTSVGDAVELDDEPLVQLALPRTGQNAPSTPPHGAAVGRNRSDAIRSVRVTS